ncbi:hypothetical protein [Nostoc sp. 2RC]|uniref:hypothetical protein n=1 Tax=Nostoc sp. 2RC TaxID=2485484 RepID=UPI0016259592|nr:hypothetical protein [Nostoc sp. 2RC]MBC1235639.1 hypothetical protein [Nostoc sp. 2RC]
MKNKIHFPIIIAVAIATTCLSACRSTDEYKKLAQAGTNYSKALNQLLDLAVVTRIDESSEELLLQDRESNQTSDDYNEFSDSDSNRIDLINRLKKHNSLLSKYFKLLQDLAGSDAPERTQTAIGGVVDNLNTIGQTLRESNLIENKEVFQGIGKLIVSSKIRGALKEELQKRNQTIMLELKTQQELLNVLSTQIKGDLKGIQDRQELRLVINPLLQPTPIADEDTWIATRRELLTQELTAAELENASQALGDFQNIFQDFVEGRSSSGRINALLTDIEDLLSVIETLKTKE